MKAVAPGSELTPGKWYRITEIDPTDPDPSLAVGDVIRCSIDPGPHELSLEWFPDFGGSWFADLQMSDADQPRGFGTLVTGLEESGNALMTTPTVEPQARPVWYGLPTHSTPGHATPTRRILGISPAELRTMVGILSHESAFGHSPTRAALVAFLGLQPVAYRLIALGWIQSRTIGPIAGARLAVWSSTGLARQALGVEASEEERLTA